LGEALAVPLGTVLPKAKRPELVAGDEGAARRGQLRQSGRLPRRSGVASQRCRPRCWSRASAAPLASQSLGTPPRRFPTPSSNGGRDIPVSSPRASASAGSERGLGEALAVPLGTVLPKAKRPELVAGDEGAGRRGKLRRDGQQEHRPLPSRSDTRHGVVMPRPQHFHNAGQLARDNRKLMPISEVALWSCIRRRQLGYRFRRQVPIGPWIADFACLDPRVVIKVDGETHDFRDETARTAS